MSPKQMLFICIYAKQELSHRISNEIRLKPLIKLENEHTHTKYIEYIRVTYITLFAILPGIVSSNPSSSLLFFLECAPEYRYVHT